jgi:hypothetical protein
MPHFCVRSHASRPRQERVAAAPVPEPAPATDRIGPTHQEIAALAFSKWEARGRPVGSPEEDWFHAERELRARNESA